MHQYYEIMNNIIVGIFIIINFRANQFNVYKISWRRRQEFLNLPHTKTILFKSHLKQQNNQLNFVQFEE